MVFDKGTFYHHIFLMSILTIKWPLESWRSANQSNIGGSMGSRHVNHMLYADDLCVICWWCGVVWVITCCDVTDAYCTSQDLKYNVIKSVCMYFRWALYKHSGLPNIYLGGNKIDIVDKTKYLCYYISKWKQQLMFLGKHYYC